MQALVWEAPHQMNLRDLPIPSPSPDEVLVKVAYVGICGSELSGYLGHNALRVPPLVMGHEFSGEIVALGANALQHNPKLSVGQMVTANPMVYCGQCAYCQAWSQSPLRESQIDRCSPPWSICSIYHSSSLDDPALASGDGPASGRLSGASGLRRARFTLGRRCFRANCIDRWSWRHRVIQPANTPLEWRGTGVHLGHRWRQAGSCPRIGRYST